MKRRGWRLRLSLPGTLVMAMLVPLLLMPTAVPPALAFTPMPCTVSLSRASGSPLTVGAEPFGIGVGYFNNDVEYDLAVVNGTSSNLSIFLGNGDGTFVPSPLQPTVSVGSGPNSIAVADFNGDLKADLVVSNFVSNNITVLFGHGDGRFVHADFSPIAVGAGPVAVVAGNISGSGRGDIAVASIGSDTVTILQNTGAAFFHAPGSPFAVGADPRDLVLDQFNGDSNLDLAVANHGPDTVTV